MRLYDEIMALESLSPKDILHVNGFDEAIEMAAELAKKYDGEIDSMAIAWAIQKLDAFGIATSSMDNALMMDRLYLMIK